MKKRNLFTNILSILILVALVFFLMLQFNVFDKMSQSLSNKLTFVALGVAVLSVVFIDIVFPVIDNRQRLVEKKYLILFILKVVLFIAAIVVLLMFFPVGIIKKPAPALIGFIVLYFAQFFINLDSKPSDDDEDEDDDEDYEDDDVDAEEYDDISEDELTEEVAENDEVSDEDVEVTSETEIESENEDDDFDDDTAE